MSTATEREERERREGGIQLLSAPGRLLCSLSFWVPDSQGAPEPSLLALYSAFQHFLAVERRNGSQQQQQQQQRRRRQHKESILVRSRGCTDIHMLRNTHTYTESSSVALWHAFGITAVVLSTRGGWGGGGGGGGGKCLYLVLPLPLCSSPGRGVWRLGECRGRDEAEGRERRERAWEKVAPACR